MAIRIITRYFIYLITINITYTSYALEPTDCPSGKKPWDYFTVDVVNQVTSQRCLGAYTRGNMVITSATCVEHADPQDLMIKYPMPNTDGNVCVRDGRYQLSCNYYPVIAYRAVKGENFSENIEEGGNSAVLYIGRNSLSHQWPSQIDGWTKCSHLTTWRYVKVVDDHESIYAKRHTGLATSSYDSNGFRSYIPLSYVAGSTQSSLTLGPQFKAKKIPNHQFPESYHGAPVFSVPCQYLSAQPILQGVVMESTVDELLVQHLVHPVLQQALQTPPWAKGHILYYIDPKSTQNYQAENYGNGTHSQPFTNTLYGYRHFQQDRNNSQPIMLAFLDTEYFNDTLYFPALDHQIVALVTPEKMITFSSRTVNEQRARVDVQQVPIGERMSVRRILWNQHLQRLDTISALVLDIGGARDRAPENDEYDFIVRLPLSFLLNLHYQDREHWRRMIRDELSNNDGRVHNRAVVGMLHRSGLPIYQEYLIADPNQRLPGTIVARTVSRRAITLNGQNYPFYQIRALYGENFIQVILAAINRSGLFNAEGHFQFLPSLLNIQHALRRANWQDGVVFTEAQQRSWDIYNQNLVQEYQTFMEFAIALNVNVVMRRQEDYLISPHLRTRATLEVVEPQEPRAGERHELLPSPVIAGNVELEPEPADPSVPSNDERALSCDLYLDL